MKHSVEKIFSYIVNIVKWVFYILMSIIMLLVAGLIIIGSLTDKNMREGLIKFIIFSCISIGGIVGVAIIIIKILGLDRIKQERITIQNTPDKPIPFGWKNTWMVIKEQPIEKIVKIINLTNSKACNWASGIDPWPHVFISPSIKGWMFIIGQPFIIKDQEKPGDSIREFIEKISKELGVVHYFFTYRVTETHCWSRAENGVLLRGYIFSGEEGTTLWDEGEKVIETELGWKLFNENSENNSKDAITPTEENVMAVARRWCITPSDLKPEDSEANLGIIGDV
jgi:hypothetical protein